MTFLFFNLGYKSLLWIKDFDDFPFSYKTSLSLDKLEDMYLGQMAIKGTGFGVVLI
jgi:hypothetical protein